MDNRDRNSPMLGRTELGLIRIVIASYFVAMSFGIVSGADPAIFFALWYPEPMAQLIGCAAMATCSLFIFFGFGVRLACVTLSILVLIATVMQNVTLAGIQNPEALWRDIVFVAMLMLIYGNQSRRGLAQLGFFRRTRTVRKVPVPVVGAVSPRRVNPGPSLRPVAEPVAQNPDVIDLPSLLAKSRRKDNGKPETARSEDKATDGKFGAFDIAAGAAQVR